MKACVWKPMAKTADGQLKESRLFNDLLSFSDNNRTKAVPLYGYLKSEEFKNEYGDKVKFDDCNEPILSSVVSNVKIKNILDESIILIGLTNKLLREFNINRDNKLQDTTENYIMLSSACVKFNNDINLDNKYTATIKEDKDSNTISIVIEPTTKLNTIKANEIGVNYALNDKIRTILSNYGISIGALNSLQERMRINGVVDYENAKITAEGLIELIRLADGIKGEKALPEEFAHFIVEIMQNHVMVSRLINLCKNQEIQKYVLEDNYDSYVISYAGNNDKLSRESAGKLVAKMFLNNEESPKEYKSFFDRVINAIKSFIRKTFKSSDINDAIRNAELIAKNISNRALSNDKITKVQLEQLSKLTNLYQLEEEASGAEKIIQKSLDSLTKEYDFYVNKLEHRINAETDDKKKEALKEKLNKYKEKVSTQISDLNTFVNQKRFEFGVEKVIAYGASELSKIVSSDLNDTTKILNRIMKSDSYSNKEKAQLLEDCKNIISSNKSLISTIEEIIFDDDSEVKLSDETLKRFTEYKTNVELANSMFLTQALISFRDYIEQYMPKEGITINSNGTNKTISRDDLKELLKTADKDISVLDTWIQSTAESGDIILRLADAALKDAKAKKMERVLEIKQKLTSLARELQNAGIKDTDFMFERHSDGTLGNRYVSEINWTKFDDDKKNSIKGESEVIVEMWMNEHFDYKTNSPKEKYYKVDIDKILPKDSVQRKYYDYFMELRKELISILPSSLYMRDPNKVIQINKDLWERVSSSPVSTWGSQLWEDFKNQLIIKSDDNQFGAKSTFEGEEYLSVPIFFVNNVDDEKNLSRDTVSTMLAFADMAINYDEMNNVAGYLELGRDIMGERKAEVWQMGKKKTERIGNTINPITSDARHIAEKYNEFLRSQLYGRFYKDSTILDTNISTNKVATMLNKLSALNQLALNGLASVSTVVNDMININTEALAKQFFTSKDLRVADKIYAENIIHVIGEAGDPVKANKLSLFIEKFDILHEYNSDVRDIEWDKGKIKKMMSSNSLYFMLHCGAHFGETRTALAQALNARIKSDDGKEESNLWDILEVVPINEADESLGCKLKVKDGYTLSHEDFVKYKKKFIGLNSRLFGNYDQADKNALESTAIGQLVMLYRRFLIPAINRRFGKEEYNLDLGQNVSGFYRSGWKFLKNLATDSKNLGFSIAAYWNDMSDLDRQNCIRAIHELSIFTVLSITAAILANAGWDKHDNPWHRRFLLYINKRAKTEIGAFSPVGLGKETWNILKSPAAAINTLEGIYDLLNLFNPLNYEEFGGEDALVKRGRYKGKSKAYKYLMNSPLVPTNKTIYRFFHPEEAFIAFD